MVDVSMTLNGWSFLTPGLSLIDYPLAQTSSSLLSNASCPSIEIKSKTKETLHLAKNRFKSFPQGKKRSQRTSNVKEFRIDNAECEVIPLATRPSSQDLASQQ